MFNTTFKRPLVTLAVVIGLLAAAGPANAASIEEAATPRTVTMIDYMGSPVVTYSRAAPSGSTQADSFLVDGPFSLKGNRGGM